MAEPAIPVSLALTLSGTASAVIGFIFDVPGSTVFAAAAGAFFAVRLAETMLFRASLMLVAGGTFAGAMMTGLIIHLATLFSPENINAGHYPQRGVAFVLAFCLIYFRKEILEAVGRTIKGFKKP
jgi:hypothetical protein